ncbi:MAG: alpha/beta hydrolase, partial [Acidobacteriota bacterium]|nr:alpha/beta hydrolase [Acidobacteriota bacterium]
MYPGSLGSQVAGLVELDSSYTNPVRTTKNSSFSLAIQKPVAEPILHAMILFSPLVRALNWLSYEEGIAQLNNAKSAFADRRRGDRWIVSRYGYESSPAVVAKGTLAMFHWDATPVLSKIAIPVLMIVGKEDTTTLPSASE